MKMIKQRIYTGIAAAALTLSLTVLTAPAYAAEVLSVNGQNIWQEAKTRVINGTTYASLRTLAGVLVPDAEVSWRSGTAWVEGNELSLCARPGSVYMVINDRVFYVPDGIRNESGSVLVPVRTIVEALDGEVKWSRQDGVTLTLGSGCPEAAPYTQDELYWLSRIISAESRGEPLLGKLAVGTVVLNRVTNSEFPNTIYGVIFDRKWGVQFEPVANGTIYNEPTEESVLAAKMVLEGARVTGDSLYFLAPDLTTNHWIMENREYVTTIGTHWFYR